MIFHKKLSKKLNKLRKHIDKIYWKKGQRLYVKPTSDWYWTPNHRYCLDIILTDEKGEEWGKYLFEIITLDMFYSLEIRANWSYLRDYRSKRNDFFNSSELYMASYKPFYMDKTFCLKKFGAITEEDIYNCTNYFLRNVLGIWLFNLKVLIPPKPKKKKRKK